MIQENYFTASQDIQNHFEKLIDWGQIIESYEQGFQDHQEYKRSGKKFLALAPSSAEEAKESYRVCLETTGKVAGEFVAPRSAEMDKDGLKFDKGKVTFPKDMLDCHAKFSGTGNNYYAIPRHYGGLGFPTTVQTMLTEILARANPSFCLTVGAPNIAGIIAEYFVDEKVAEEWVSRVTSGELWSAMALSEPNHGSDLSNITTQAEKDKNGKWIINGTKRYITHGCGFNDIPAFIATLARTGKPGSGARGLSFFAVDGANVKVEGIEKKMGLHCSPTCKLVYKNAPATLIGKEGMGLVKYAMGLMNRARLNVASLSLGLAQAAVSEAKKYASERLQFGRPIQDIVPVRNTLRSMERELLAMRCLHYETARCMDLYKWPKLYIKKKGKASAEVFGGSEARKWEKLANFYTPLAKYYLSEMCSRLAYDGLQVFGGSGYTEDYDLSRISRDARVTNIMEGTTHLQIVAAVGGISAGMAPKGYLREYIGGEMKKFSPSSILQGIYRSFDELCAYFRQIKDSDLRDGLAFELVESSARFLCSMLLERSLVKFSGKKAEERAGFIEEFNIDSEAIIKANMLRVQRKATV